MIISKHYTQVNYQIFSHVTDGRMKITNAHLQGGFFMRLLLSPKDCEYTILEIAVHILKPSFSQCL